MKTLKLALIVTSLLTANIIFSQENGWVEYTWTPYYTQFKLPDNFHVITNNNEEFRAGTDDGVYLFQIFESLGCACGDTNMLKDDLNHDAEFNNMYGYAPLFTSANLNGYACAWAYGRKLNSQNKETYMGIWVLDHPKYPVELHVYFSSGIYETGALMTVFLQNNFKPVY